jgi:hypothetical protein
MLEHYKEHMSGHYRLYNPGDYIRGVKNLLWWPSEQAKQKISKERLVPEFHKKFHELAQPIAELVRIYRFYLAPLEQEKRLRERIESGLYDHLRANS